MTFDAIIAAIETTADLGALSARNIEARNAKTITVSEFVRVRRAIDAEKMTRFRERMDGILADPHRALSSLA